MINTKIVCTIGPASSDEGVIEELINAGMSVARINFSHGDHEAHLKTINNVKKVREKLGKHVALMLDTQGPEIRIGKFKKDKIFLERGQEFTLKKEDTEGDKNSVSVSYKRLSEDVNLGDRILIDDGLIALEVVEIINSDVKCIVRNSSFLSSRKGVNIPQVYVNMPSLTDKDIKDILFGIEHKFDFIAASFIRTADDIIKIKNILEDNEAQYIQIISKIENAQGVENIEEILDLSDGIMVARGDLGVEIPPEEIPLIQKELISKTNRRGIPVITATQMLESMVTNPVPTRAEANDVANAILDGSDAIMLSAETAIGEHPVAAVKMMSKIAKNTESALESKVKSPAHFTYESNITNAICFAAASTAQELKASCIATVTSSGFTARMVSKYRPKAPIVASSYNAHVCRQLSLVWGVNSVLIGPFNDKDDIFKIALEQSLNSMIAKNGDLIVLVAGTPVGESGATNSLKIEMVGDVFAKGYSTSTGIINGKSNVIKDLDEAAKKFKSGDVLICSETNNKWIPYIKKAKAVIVGPSSQTEGAHIEIVSAALGIPALISNQSVIMSIPDNSFISINFNEGKVSKGK